MFEEKINLLNFINDKKEPVKVNYKYSLPTETTHGDGLELSNGIWKTAGEWQNSTYSYSNNTSVVEIKIPDGMQYEIEGVDFKLENSGGNEFTKTVDFKYSMTDGKSAADYACDFFIKKGVNSVITQEDKFIICRLIFTGSASEITQKLTEALGTGNYIKYESKHDRYSVVNNTTFEDCINIESMLSSINAAKTISYTVRGTGNETIKTVSVEGEGYTDTVRKADETNRFTVNIKKGNGIVRYSGAIPNSQGIIVFTVISSLMVLITVISIVFQFRKSKISKSVPSEEFAPKQTTTFSINELNTRNEELNKKLKMEIESEVQAEIDKQNEKERLDRIKAEIRAKNISDMEAKIYGSKKTDNEDKK